MSSQKRCFVVMGFGTKTDLATGRKLDLNKSYRLLIKPVVEEMGLECIRADEIRHSGAIDLPMYQELLKADVVIADLSTANLNAFYELGIRHALRPRTTIVVSEDKLAYPFDLNHIKITSYTHLGDAIDYDEVQRFRNELGKTIEAVLHNETPDSPVYTHLQSLNPPSLQEQAIEAIDQLEDALEKASTPLDSQKKKSRDDKTLALLAEQGEQAIRNKKWKQAKALFNSAVLIGKEGNMPPDPYLLHRLSLVTYKSEEPDIVTALKNSLALLEELDLAHTNDAETVALAGAIEKRLYETGGGDEHIENAILFYNRGYYLLNNRYNGINLAFMLNCRANSPFDATDEERIADLILANRTRQRVLVICQRDWNEISNREQKHQYTSMDDELAINQLTTENEHKFWILVNKAEAYYGLGQVKEYEQARSDAAQLEHADWMMETFDAQVRKLGKLLKKYGHLLNPPWPIPVEELQTS